MLSENSLYNTQKEKDDFLKNSQNVIDSLIINFFGFVGLYSIGLRGPMKLYSSTEKQLTVKNIKDDNLDPSLSIRLFYELDIVPVSVIAQMTKLLSLIKQKKLTSKDLNHDVIRDLLKKVKIESFMKELHLII